MADRDRTTPAHQLQVRPAYYGTGTQSSGSGSGPSASQVIAVATLLPVGGSLLGLAGLTLVGSLIGLAVATPLFVIFSPVIVPAALTIALAVMAFLASGAFGLTALSSLTYVLNCLRQATGSVPEQLDMAKRRMADLAEYTGQKTKEVGQTIQSKAQEAGRDTSNVGAGGGGVGGTDTTTTTTTTGAGRKTT